MNYLVYLGHPAHFHLFKHAISELKRGGHDVRILIRKKDVLEELLQASGWQYSNILPTRRGDGWAAIFRSVLSREIQLWHAVRRRRPLLMIGTSAEIAHIGRIMGIASLVVNEDDADVVPWFSHLAYPFASHILAPVSCRSGRWEQKTIFYNGYHELAYLHPNHFAPAESVRYQLASNGDPYFILRFAQLTAHHDAGKRGIDAGVARELIQRLTPCGRIYITSERPLEAEFERYRIRLEPQHMHHALYYAKMYIGDSQTMAAEAAVLGTPSLRFNDFVGRIGYLEELEHRYGLTQGIPTAEPQRLYGVVEEWLAKADLKAEWQRRRQAMLAEKIDVAAFMTWFIENYPRSASIIRDNREAQAPFMMKLSPQTAMPAKS